MGKFLLGVLVFGYCLNGFTQQYNFINYSIEEGLIQSQVRTICQDKEGYIWLGTLGGISRFNGINFQNFSIHDGLLDNSVYALYTGTKGNVFIGSKGGIHIFDGSRFQTCKFRETV